MINKIIIIFVLFTVSFIQPNDKPKIKDGAIFGKVAYLETGNIKPFKITLMGANKIVQADSEGYFYINNLKPGLYDLKIQIEGLIDHFAEKINELSSKISCIGTLYIERSLDGIIEWGIIEYQENIAPIKYGKIEGYIVDSYNRYVPNTLISYNYDKYLWDGKSDSTGYFKISKVVPGQYQYISAYCWWADPLTIDVRPNHITKVKIKVSRPHKFHIE